MNESEQVRDGWFWFGALALVTVPLSIVAIARFIFEGPPRW